MSTSRKSKFHSDLSSLFDDSKIVELHRRSSVSKQIQTYRDREDIKTLQSMKYQVYDLFVNVPIYVIQEQAKAFQETLKEIFNEAGFICDIAKQEELLKLVLHLKSKAKIDETLGLRSPHRNPKYQFYEKYTAAIEKWLVKNKEFFLDKVETIFKKEVVLESYSPKTHLHKLKNMHEKQETLEKRKSLILGVKDPRASIGQMRRDSNFVKDFTQSNLKSVTKAVKTFTDQQSTVQNKKLMKKDEVNFEEFQLKRQQTKNKSPKNDTFTKTFYTEQEDHMEVKQIKFEGVDSPYMDSKQISNKKMKSTDESQTLSQNQSEKTIRYQEVQNQIQRVFDGMEFDDKQLRDFKKNFYEKKFNSEAKSKELIVSQNYRIKNIVKEKLQKKQLNMQKNLQNIYAFIPHASAAWKFEQLMTTRCLGEMPQDYVIKSHFDFNSKAKKRVDKLTYDII